MKNKPAILGGVPTYTKTWPEWPIFDDAERKQLEDVLQSRMWCYGPYVNSKRKGSKVAELQNKFARLVGVKYATAVANGTAALEVALRAAGIGLGDKVIVPSYTFFASASAVLQIGATPIFCDIDPETFNLDVEHAASLITKRTRAIIPVYFGGLPVDMDAVMKLKRKHKLIVVEDCAQAGGSRWKDKRVGAIGDIGCFSFQQSKSMTAGEGGMITTNGKALADRIFSYYNLGRKQGRPQYEHHVLPWNYRLAEFLAGVLIAQLRRLPGQIRLRTRTANALSRRLSRIEGIQIRKKDNRVTAHANSFYIFRYDKRAFSGLTRNAFLAALRAEGVPAGSGYSMPLQEQPLFRHKKDFPSDCDVDYSRQKTPQAKKLCREAVMLPINILMAGPQAVDNIAEAIKGIQHSSDKLAGML